MVCQSREHGTRQANPSCSTYHRQDNRTTRLRHTGRKQSHCAKRVDAADRRCMHGATTHDPRSTQVDTQSRASTQSAPPTNPPSPNCVRRMLVSNTTSPSTLARNTTRRPHYIATSAESSSHYTQTATGASFVTVTTCSKGPLLHCRLCSRDRARARESVVTVG